MEGWKVPEELDKLLKNVGVGVRPVEDPYFEESHRVCGIFQRLGVHFVDEEEFCHPAMKEFTCNALGCTERFQTLVEYEMHYNGCHRYTCMECKKTRPSSRLLDIHIQETHDSFFKVSAERQPMYQCFVSDCFLKFSTSDERKQHCMKIHKFPKNYRYDEMPRGKSSKKGKSKTKQNNEAPSEALMEVSSSKVDNLLSAPGVFGRKKKKKYQEPSDDFMEVAPSQASEESLLSYEKIGGETLENGRSKEYEYSMKVDASKELPNNPTKKPNLYKNQKVRTFVPNLKNPPLKSSDEQILMATEATKITSTPSPSILAFVPRQLTRKPDSYSQILTRGKKMERDILESNIMMDLVEALPE